MKSNLFSIHQNDALTNARIKYYYDENGVLFPAQLLYCAEGKVFRNPLYECDIDELPTLPAERDEGCVSTPCPATNSSAVIRARRNLYDLLRCNKFTHFVTLTYDKEKVDREDYGSVIRKFNQWFDNRVRRHNLFYVGVAERHKQSNGIHFHVCTNDALALVDSGTVKCHGHKRPIKIKTADKYGVPMADRKTVYNISDWCYGFSTALEITGDPKGIKVAQYLKKYLTKDTEKVGGRFYYSGGMLRRPVYKYVDTEVVKEDASYIFEAGKKTYYGVNLEA